MKSNGHPTIENPCGYLGNPMDIQIKTLAVTYEFQGQPFENPCGYRGIPMKNPVESPFGYLGNPVEIL